MTIYEKYLKICELFANDTTSTSLHDSFIIKAFEYIAVSAQNKRNTDEYTTAVSSLQALNSYLDKFGIELISETP